MKGIEVFEVLGSIERLALRTRMTIGKGIINMRLGFVEALSFGHGLNDLPGDADDVVCLLEFLIKVLIGVSDEIGETSKGNHNLCN